ncbi:MerR family transcriptional regulator [Gammaproteobacteria bacterium 45_16_T64]|nr:MerR family transcriptional regulator [Gammaproteobacteria bacterium 45_16_T64]
MPNIDLKTFTISELAKEFDVTTRAIRFYEDKGILSPTREGQKRIYSPRDRVLLKLTLRGKRIGFTLSESQKLFDMYQTGENNEDQLHTMLATLDEKDALLSQQKLDIEEMEVELQAARDRCLNALRNIKENTV